MTKEGDAGMREALEQVNRRSKYQMGVLLNKDRERVKKTLASLKQKQYTEEKNDMDKYAMIPNSGVTPNQRLSITAGSTAIVGVGASIFVWDWPAFFFADLWGAALYTAGIAAGTFLMVKRKKTPFELAVAEFSDLNLRPELIGEVIVENRAKAHALLMRARQDIEHPMVRKLVKDIAEETLEIINGFRDDPSDVARSRSVLRRCLDQTDKIVANYTTVETRRDKLGTFDQIVRDTQRGLAQIKDVLFEQHKRNMENNTTALDIDLEVSDQLLSRLSN